MVDTARQLLDELMGRNRNLDPSTAKCKKINWDDAEYCLYYLVKFCPHDLFVNTRADLGQCQKVHDEEAKRMYEEARPTLRKRSYEDEFLRFSNHMINEVDRKIIKGKQRLLLMNKGDQVAPPVYVSKFQEQLNNLNARIKKLIGEAEEAGNRGDVDQAQGLMTLCDQLKEEKEIVVKQHESQAQTTPGPATPGHTVPGNPPMAGNNSQWTEFGSNEKQMEVCEVCGAFLIVGDAQQRIEDHLTGKQHLGYSRLRKAVDEMYGKRKAERNAEERLKEDERKQRYENGIRDRGDRRGGDETRRHSRDRYDDRRRRGGGNGGDDRRDRDRDRRDSFKNADRDRRDNRDRDRYRGRNDRNDFKRRSRSRSKH